jgi:hypothetical protein
MRRMLILVLTVFVVAAFGNLPVENAKAPGIDMKIAVTPAGFDDMGSLLNEWGYAYTEIADSDLSESSVTSQYDAIFINCDSYSQSDVENAASNLATYVSNGGAIYASDWANEFIDASFPGYVNFGDGSTSSQYADAKIKDKGLIDYLEGQDSLTFHYDLALWVQIESVSSEVTVLAEANVEYGGTTHPHMPAVVSFSKGKGSVVYTTFHEAVQGGLVKKMMQYLMLYPLTAASAYQIQKDLTDAGYQILKDNRGELDQGEAMEYTIKITSPDDLKFELNWGGSDLKLSVYKPNGELYSEQSSSNPPVSIAVDNAEAGDWKYKVEAVSVPVNHYPYALMVGGKSGAGGDGLPLWMLGLIIAIVAAVIIVVAVVALRKRKPPTAPQYPQQPQQPGYQQQPYPQQQYYQPPQQPPQQPPPQGPPPQYPPPPPGQ